MTDRVLGRMLRRLYRTPPPPPNPALEQAMVERFQALQPRPARGRRPPLLRRIAIAASVLVVLGAASRAPAEYAVELGRRIELNLPPGARPPGREVLEGAVGPGHRRAIRVRVGAAAESTHVEIDLFGDRLPSVGELDARLRSAFPNLPASAITVLPIDGRVHDSLGGALRWEVLRLGGSPHALARARERLIERVESEAGPGAHVEVRIRDREGNSRVEIRVEKSIPRSP